MTEIKLAHSELTNTIYALIGKEKIDITEQAIAEVKAIKVLEQEQKVGHWLYNNGSYKCEFCHHEITGREEDLNYCCKCGAKLESEVEDELL